MMAVISPIPGVQVTAVGVGLVPVEKGESPSADFLFKGSAGPLEQRMVKH